MFETLRLPSGDCTLTCINWWQEGDLMECCQSTHIANACAMCLMKTCNYELLLLFVWLHYRVIVFQTCNWNKQGCNLHSNYWLTATNQNLVGQIVVSDLTRWGWLKSDVAWPSSHTSHGRTRSTSWLFMHWLLVSLVHPQPWYRLNSCGINGSSSSIRNAALQLTLLPP